MAPEVQAAESPRASHSEKMNKGAHNVGSLELTPSERRRLRHAFRTYDTDGDGRISKKELLAMMRCFSSTCTEESVQELINEIDYNGDGFVDFEEFVILNRVAIDCSKPKEDLAAVFRMFDLDKDGKISPVELHQVLSIFGDKNKSLEDCKKMIASWDTDGDGNVDISEFEKMMSDKALL